MKRILLLQLLILNCLFQLTSSSSSSCYQQTDHKFNITADPAVSINCVNSSVLDANPNNSIEWRLLPSTVLMETTNSLNISEAIYTVGVNTLECKFTLNSTNASSEIITCLVKVTINSPPVLSFSPSPPHDPITYPSGTTIECIANGGFPDSTVTWVDSDGYSLSTNSTLTFNSNQSVIGDNKSFVCRADNSIEITSSSISITVKPNPPSVDITQLPTTVFIGSDTTLTCIAVSSLTSVTYDYRWYKDNALFTSSSGVTVNGGLVTIIDTRTRDNGMYTCNATVLNSDDGTDSIQLTVTSPAPLVSITADPAGSTLTVGSSIALTCVVTPQPEDGLSINVVWLNRTLGIVSGDNGTVLTLSSITLSNDGNYICQASVGNSDTVTSDPHRIDVVPLAPAVTVNTNDSTPLIGESVSLSCDVADTSGSTLSPIITWYNNGNIIPGQTNQVYILGPVYLSDTSSYSCSASIEGSAATNSFPVDITVYQLPMITSIPGSPQPIIEGNTSSLSCTADGTPDPNIEWSDKNGITYPNPLSLSALTNLMSGTFTCNASSLANPEGVTDSIEIIIVPPAPSLAVTTSSTNPVEGRSFTLSCSVQSSFPMGQTITSYQFTWTRINDPTVIVTSQNYSFIADNETVGGTQYQCTATVAGSAEGSALSPVLSLQRVPTKPNFSIPNEIYIGKSYSVKCESTGIPEPMIYITNREGAEVNSPAPDLDSFTEASVGTEVYTCTSENIHGNDTTGQTFEIKKPIITIDFTSDPQSVTNGQSFVLNCSFTTDPYIPPAVSTFTFEINQTLIASKPPVDPESQWASLTIDQSSYEPNTVYTCSISIQDKKINVEKTLLVPEIPTSEPLLYVAVAVSVIALILLLVFVCLILLLLLCCLRHRRKKDIVPARTGDYIGLNTPMAEQSLFSYPIPVTKYSEVLDTLHEDNQQKLKEQYQQLAAIKGNTEEAKKPVNAVKNRYPDVLAYDHSRVPISKHQGTDYINANYMDGFRKSNSYIAAQGPLGPPKDEAPTSTSTANGGAATPQLNTVSDFWRMIWELNITTIVMLTNLIENNRVKCALYWPEDTKNYGRIRVRKVEESRFCDYIVRKFSIQRIQVRTGDSETRQITQFHFVAWPDHGVPLFPIAMIQFVKLVRSYINQSGDDNNAPDLVHCSAGVGRTGTFICLDIVLQQLANGDTSIDIWRETAKLRKRRNHMIQEYLQYEFVHQAINEHIQFGDTECSAANFPKMVTRLNEVTDDNPYKVGMSRLEIQFKKLQLRVVQSQHKDAMLNENAGKNRYINTMPFDTNRVKLRPLPGIVGSDYINASHIDSDKTHWAFVATQGPLKTTMEDFCRMLIEKGSSVIIMLSENTEDKTEDYFSFSQTHYGQYHFHLVKKHLHNDYVHREMVIRLDNNKNGHQVHHFQLTKLLSPNHSHKDCAKAMLSLITGVMVTLQPEETKRGPMVVHCGGGNGMTGVFMTVFIIIQRLQYEDKVDVFNTVKRLRMQRVAMVQSVDQYDLCHRTVMEYLQSSP